MFRYSKEPIFEERRAESHSTNRETPVPKTQLSYNEYYKYFNKLQPDGRVNLGPDEDGELFSLSIPPYLDGFLDNIEETGATICGKHPIAVLIELCKLLGASKGRLLKYYTSGDILGDYSNAVGYASIVFE